MADDNDDQNSEQQDQTGTDDGQQSTTQTFPANTPWQDMKPGEQVAYWRHQARRHEDRAKPFKDLSPEKLAELREKAGKHDELEHELSSDADKRERAAREAAESEKDSHYRPKLAETAFRVAIGNRKTKDEVDEFIADLNLPRFLNDQGDVDTVKVLARVDQFAPATGNQQRKGPTVTGHGSGNGGENRSGGGSVAEVMAERRAAREAKKISSKS